MIELLGSLSASAAGGMRIALPILVIGVVRSERLWSDIPGLNLIHPQVLLSILISWSLFELFASKKLLGQRLLQILQLCLSPLVGGLLGFTIFKTKYPNFPYGWLVVLLGAVLALILKLVTVGWFFRLKGLPISIILLEDFLSVLMVLMALKAPEEGGLIAMLLLWIAIRSAGDWARWYRGQPSKPD